MNLFHIYDIYNKIKIMHKSFLITEEEKNRILGMHNNATSKQYLKENEEETIRIPRKYNGVIMELGKDVNPQDIIGMYNELVSSEGESVPLEKYEDGYFWNEYMDEIPVDVVLDELNYSIVGEEEDYDDEEEY